ncbi:MAG: response regulator [Verrucomicrobia bacterium]|nr:MAG: response regulator [Verrucomicrobiota bacterium]
MGRLAEATFFHQSSEAIKQKPRVLIIDDNPGFTRAAKLLLEKTRSYVVCEENDATVAHQTAQSFKPDLILLDIAMPQTDGGEVAARIQSDPALRRIPVVFLTALVTKAETKSGLEIEGHPFLAKPISFEELIESIEENLPWRARSVHG